MLRMSDSWLPSEESSPYPDSDPTRRPTEVPQQGFPEVQALLPSVSSELILDLIIYCHSFRTVASHTISLLWAFWACQAFLA